MFAYNLKTARAKKMKSKWNRNPAIAVSMVWMCVCVWAQMCVHLERVGKSREKANEYYCQLLLYAFVIGCFWLRFLRCLYVSLHIDRLYIQECRVCVTFFPPGKSLSRIATARILYTFVYFFFVFYGKPSKYCNLAFVKWILVRNNPMLLHKVYEGTSERMNEWVNCERIS